VSILRPTSSFWTGPQAAVIGAMQSNTLLAPTLHWIATVRGRSMTHIWQRPLLRDLVAQAPIWRSGQALLAATYAHLGHLDEARKHVAEVIGVEPNFTITGTQRKLMGFKRPYDDKLYFEGLRKAGLPD
jgi:hypothetical protein